MNLKYITMVVVVLLAFAFTVSTGAAKTDSQTTSDDIQEYNGPIGSDHALYGWKLALQDLDEAFTLNQSDKLAKKIAHLEERIAEYKAASTKKNVKAAQKAIEVYEEKSKDIENSVSEVSDKDKKGLLNAYEMIQKHQNKLHELMNSGHGKGLEKAYNNSVELQEKFRIKHNIEDDDEEDADDKLIDSIKIKAKTSSSGNTTVEIEMEFMSNNFTNATVAQEIRNKFLTLDKANITNMTRFENTSAEEELKEELEAKARIINESSKVEVEYKFWLNETNKSEIIDGIVAKLTGTNDFLNVTYIINVLEIKSEDRVGVTTSNREIKKEEQEMKKEEKKEDKGRNGRED